MTSKENQASTDFSTLALSPAIGEPAAAGLHHDDPIQAASLPPALLGNPHRPGQHRQRQDRRICCWPKLANLNPRRFAVQALVLCPTRDWPTR